MKMSPPTLQPWQPGENPEKDIVVLMSGGVDSSVTAMLLKKSGWNVVGVTMKIPIAQNCDYSRSCCGMQAAYVCRHLDIPHYYLDVQSAFERLVIEPFRESYARGETPSPCVDCNTVFKFSLVWEFVEQELGISNLATGHYARITGVSNARRLARAKDRNKDQSYFLYGIPKHRLNHFHLPLGELTKEEVRDLAKEERLPVARRPESMELCFAGAKDYRDALGDIEQGRGHIVDSCGRILGEHRGIANYTLGQRKGIGVAAKTPLYVTAISPEDNSVTVGTRDEVLRRDVQAGQLNILIDEELKPGVRLLGKIRSQGEPSECTIVYVDSKTVYVEFDEQQFAPSPGQRLVLYNREERVVAGGAIL